MPGLMDDPAYTVSCPACQAKANQPCRYLPPKSPTHTPSWNRSAAQQEKLARVGTETKRPHYQRSNKVVDKREAERRKAYWAKVTKPPAALFALRDFDRAEYTKLKDWLRSYGHILYLRPWNMPMSIDQRFAAERAWDTKVKP